MRIVFVRHGDPDYANDCLTELGRRQAQAAAVRLREEGIERVFTSPMGRARETARAACEQLQLEDAQVLDFMHEISWGSTDSSPLFAGGHPWACADEMVRTGWDLSDPSWPDHPFFRTNKATADVSLVAAGIDSWLETLGYRREGAYYRCIRNGEEPHTVALFSHGGSSAAAIAHIFNLTFPYVCAVLRTSFTGLTVARFDPRPGSIAPPCLELADEGRHAANIPQHSPAAP